MPKINIRLKKQAIELHLVRSVHLDARKIFPYEHFLFVQQVARYGFTLCIHTTTMTHKG